MATKADVLALHTKHHRMHPNEIAAKLGCNPAYVRATLARAKGYKPPRPAAISAAERTEREQDMRDLDILADIREGHSVRDTARHWGVTTSHIERLKKHAREAA